MTLESERERIRDLCSREGAGITVKIPFGKVSFLTSFEGREGRAMTDGKRKEENSRSVQQRSTQLEKQTTPPYCFLRLSVKVGMRKVLSKPTPQRPRSDVHV